MNKSVITISFPLRITRRPLSIFSKIITITLLFLSIVMTLLASLVAKSMVLFTFSVLMFLIAGLVGELWLCC